MEQDRSMDFGFSQEVASERTFLSQVYLWMAMALALTGFVAGWMAMSPTLVTGLMRNTMLFFVIMIGQIGIVIWLSRRIMSLSLTGATAGFGIYATLNGVLFSTLFLVYTGASIASTFIVTAGTFAAVSVYGFTTKRDLTSIGSFCFMGLIGIILASVVNWFFRSPALYWMITYAGIAIFIGLTAYDTQKLKQIHREGFSSTTMMKKIALLGALRLYLDFINLFLLLLRVMGRRR
jgi:uncharacterized protein